MNSKPSFSFEAHRGGRGLMPENTIPAMLNAVDIGVDYLELDVVISKDNKVVVSHDHHFNEAITTTPNGKSLSKKAAQSLVLYNMNYDDIKQYDVGSKPYPKFPEQQKIKTYKPLLSDMIDSVEAYAKSKHKTIRYNVEIKSGEKTDGILHPDVKTFSEMIVGVLKDKQVLDRSLIQSFDVRPLEYIHKNYPEVQLAVLIEASPAPLQQQLSKLTFTPNVYSPNATIVTRKMVEQCHLKGMKVVPWTVNKLEEMNALVAMGVDGIISDFPNLFKYVKFDK